MNHVVCRLTEDDQGDPLPFTVDTCSECLRHVYVEDGLQDEHPKVCLHCCVEHYPSTVVFVELRPDNARRFMAKSVREVLEADGGQWHKFGNWHAQQWVLAHQE